MRCIRDGIDTSVVDDELCLGIEFFIRPLSSGCIEAVGTVEIAQELHALLCQLLSLFARLTSLRWPMAHLSERCHELVKQVPGRRVGSITVHAWRIEDRNVFGAQFACLVGQLDIVDKIAPMLCRGLVHVESEVAVFFAVGREHVVVDLVHVVPYLAMFQHLQVMNEIISQLKPFQTNRSTKLTQAAVACRLSVTASGS